MGVGNYIKLWLGLWIMILSLSGAVVVQAEDTAATDTSVAQLTTAANENTYYDSLQEAFSSAALKAGSKVKILKNCEMGTSPFVLESAGASFAIDFNGFTITTSANQGFIIKAGTVTFQDSTRAKNGAFYNDNAASGS